MMYRYSSTAMHIPASVVTAIIERFTENDLAIGHPTMVKVHDHWVIVENVACMSQDDPGYYVMSVDNDDLDEVVTIHTGWVAEPTIKFRYDGTLVED